MMSRNPMNPRIVDDKGAERNRTAVSGRTWVTPNHPTDSKPVVPAGYDSYLQYLASSKWRAKRSAVLTRAAGSCEWCSRRFSQRGPTPHVHHLTYVRVGDEELEDLVALCRVCHGETHRPRQDPHELDADWLDLERWPAPPPEQRPQPGERR